MHCIPRCLSWQGDESEYYSDSTVDTTNKWPEKHRKYLSRQNINKEAPGVKEETQLEYNKNPISREIIVDDTSVDITHMDPSPIMHNDVAYAKFSLGFYHWIHASKNKTEIFDQFIGKKKVYQVINGYERYIDDYADSIGTVSKSFFDLENKPNIASRAFYKLWEMIYYYDLVDTTNKDFRSAHLAEGPGSFVQATMFFRDLYAKESKNDKYYAITIHSEDEDNSLEMEKKFVEYYEGMQPQRFYMHKTYNAKTASNSDKDNGNLIKVKTILNFKSELDRKIDLITGDGGFDWNNRLCN